MLQPPDSNVPPLELTEDRIQLIKQLVDHAADKKVRISITSTSLHIEPITELGSLGYIPASLGPGFGPGRAV